MSLLLLSGLWPEKDDLNCLRFGRLKLFYIALSLKEGPGYGSRGGSVSGGRGESGASLPGSVRGERPLARPKGKGRGN